MKILSIFVRTNYGATIVSVHQTTWFFQTSYENLHTTYLDSTIAQRFITQLSFDKITQLRHRDDFFYLRKISLTDDRSLVYVTNQEIVDTKIMSDLFDRIQKSIGNIHDLSGLQEKEKCMLALKHIIDNPHVAFEKKHSVTEEKPRPRSGILFFDPKDIPKFDDSSDWSSLDYTHKGGLYEMDH